MLPSPRLARGSHQGGTEAPPAPPRHVARNSRTERVKAGPGQARPRGFHHPRVPADDSPLRPRPRCPLAQSHHHPNTHTPSAESANAPSRRLRGLAVIGWFSRRAPPLPSGFSETGCRAGRAFRCRGGAGSAAVLACSLQVPPRGVLSVRRHTRRHAALSRDSCALALKVGSLTPCIPRSFRRPAPKPSCCTACRPRAVPGIKPCHSALGECRMERRDDKYYLMATVSPASASTAGTP
jgi:hypothetical protein